MIQHHSQDTLNISVNHVSSSMNCDMGIASGPVVTPSTYDVGPAGAPLAAARFALCSSAEISACHHTFMSRVMREHLTKMSSSGPVPFRRDLDTSLKPRHRRSQMSKTSSLARTAARSQAGSSRMDRWNSVMRLCAIWQKKPKVMPMYREGGILKNLSNQALIMSRQLSRSWWRWKSGLLAWPMAWPMSLYSATSLMMSSVYRVRPVTISA